MYYIIALVVLIVLYGLGIYFMKYLNNTKMVNIIVVSTIFITYIIFVLRSYFHNGWSDWNFQNTLPVANVSPFMFGTLFLYFIIPKKVKKYYLLLIALLSVGMFLSPTFGCIYNASISYKFHIHFLMDYISHFLLSWWGVYVVRSNQVELRKKDCAISGAIIVCVAIIMLILNIIFDTAFFGLSLNGKHNIYNMVLVGNSYLSAVLYLSGLCVVLLCGYCYQRVLKKIPKN